MDSGAVLDRVLILRLCHGQEWCCDSLSVPVRIVGEVNGRQTARSSSMQTAETRGCWAFLGSLSQISAFFGRATVGKLTHPYYVTVKLLKKKQLRRSDCGSAVV